MIQFPEGVQTRLASGLPVLTRALAWIEARERDTGAAAPIGLWNGDDAQVFTVDGEARIYHGPAFGPLPPISGGVGLQVRQLKVPFPRLTPEGRAVLRTYDASGAPVSIHFAFWDAQTRAFLGLVRVWRGEIDDLPETIGAAGQASAATVTIVSASRELTRKVPLYRSDGDQQNRQAGDLGRQYAGSTRRVFWGQGDVVNGGGSLSGGGTFG